MAVRIVVTVTLVIGRRYQQKYKMEAMRGLGVDRHLFGLYVAAKGMKMDPMPDMFEDKVKC